ncbi:TPA: GNAT family protein [Streptococcus pneumoniae]|uniref:GNAT family N-acetyltransferase n=1 Tax=Streptococcus pneumoniae TaxID=1313 RepID=UPI0009DA059B|nr:GNAT family protein [Streptococcus pneumoniae]
MIYLRKLKKEDLMSLWEMAYSQLNPVWKQYDAPYYDDYQYFSNFKEFELQKSESILSNSNRLGIFVDDKLVETVSRYWVCKQTRWMELGIGIYDKKFWNTGIGKVAMLQWIDRTFQDYLELEHLGLTTWSGNFGMMKLAEKLRMKKEAHIPKVRYYQGVYYDSIKYGILREEWEEANGHHCQTDGNS